jgi:8-oxo-dGTP pyrophosphatase MutT (NUDIX family)
MQDKCPRGFCRDAEYCGQGGRCEDAIGDLMPVKCIAIRSRVTLVGAVHLFLTNSQDKILLLRRANTGYEDGKYSVPAGHIEPGESAINAMVREAEEEIGVVIDPIALYLVHVMHRRSVGVDCTNSERVDFFFTASWFDGEPVNRELMKCDEMRWVRMKPLPANVVPYVRRAFEYYQLGVPYSELGWSVACPVCGAGGYDAV